MNFFIEAWSQLFQSVKYPIEFYFYNIEGIQAAKSSGKLGEHIIALLHWKDGKVRKDSSGSVLVAKEKYVLLQTKPNTYHPKKHKETFFSSKFFDWVQEVKALDKFDASKLKDLSNEFHLYGKDTIVIPSFILHIISPFIYPLYDQHVERAKRILLAQNINLQHKDVNFLSYNEYQKFFYDILKDYPSPTIQDIKKIDNALWSFGKWLKTQSEFKDEKIKKKTTNNSLYTPNNDFKMEVLKRVEKGNISQREIMKTVALLYGVTLPESYYKYPGSHINRWRKQIIDS